MGKALRFNADQIKFLFRIKIASEDLKSSFYRNIAINKYSVMKLSELQEQLQALKHIEFRLPDGDKVPAHFHVTEVGKIEKTFIDCGGKLRHEQAINLQLWSSIDFTHRLSADKLRDILNLSVEKLALPDAEIEVEYQGQTIEKFALDFRNDHFLLVAKSTDCLAKDNCGIPLQKVKLPLAGMLSKSTSCEPGSGCC